MIKINLLESVTDRARSVAVVEAKVANPRMRSRMLLFVVAALMFLGMGFDWMSANSAHATAQADLEREEAIAARMEAIKKEQSELEKKISEIQVRIDAIKKLRASQQGPVSVLSSINDRLPSVADFRLESIEQKAGELTVEGHSPNEAAVTQFGRSLEFSSGLFSNVSIETERKKVEIAASDLKPEEGAIDMSAPKPETVKFKIKCKYTPPGSAEVAVPSQPTGNTTAAAPAANQIAQK
ncbi:MAG TPA: PilN domain-containing protein [Pyrinomonadaceae bacterium]|jgi:Tfp pilus assembly protein PilN